MDVLWKLLFLVVCLPVGVLVAGTIVAWHLLLTEGYGGPEPALGCALIAIVGLAIGLVGGLVWLALGGSVPFVGGG